MAAGPVPTLIGVPTAFVATLIGMIVPGVKPGSNTELSINPGTGELTAATGEPPVAVTHSPPALAAAGRRRAPG